MEEQTVTGIVDDTEDSDISLLIVNDADENTGDASSNDGANPRIPDAAVSDGTPVNPVLEMGMETTCPVSEATTQDAVVVTSNDSSCSRRRRRSRHHRRFVIVIPSHVSLLLTLTGKLVL